MRKRLFAIFAVIMIVAIAASMFVATKQTSKLEIYKVASNEPFYVGVNFCGNTTSEAKNLIDEVKNYTNLFVLQSGSMLNDVTDINEVCDYAASSGLHFILYSSGTRLLAKYPMARHGKATLGQLVLRHILR